MYSYIYVTIYISNLKSVTFKKKAQIILSLGNKLFGGKEKKTPLAHKMSVNCLLKLSNIRKGGLVVFYCEESLWTDSTSAMICKKYRK